MDLLWRLQAVVCKQVLAAGSEVALGIGVGITEQRVAPVI